MSKKLTIKFNQVFIPLPFMVSAIAAVSVKATSRFF